jgi:hypothetical protein
MQMHLEGKLHTGYQKIRKVLSDLLAKREQYRTQKEREARQYGGRGYKSRSPSPRAL